MAINYLSDINLNKNTLENVVVHPLSTAPSTPVEGQIYYNNTAGDKKLYIYNGTSFNPVDGTSVATDTTLGSLKVYTGTGATANTITSTASRNYGVQLDGNSKAVVNVPWTDTVYTHTTNANLTGDVTSSGNITTLTNASVIAQVLTGYISNAGTVVATDSIIRAVQKLNGNNLLKAPLASPTFTGTINGADLVLSGDLTVNGTTTNLNSTNLVVEDKNIVLGDTTTPTDITADGGGITLKGAVDKTFNWVNATDSWTSSEHLNLLTGKKYAINGTSVLDATTLGSSVVNSSLASVGVIGIGTWQATAITGRYGGTGVDNSGKTITLGGNLTTSGTHATTLTTTGATTVTLPTSGTLATEAYVSARNKSFNLATATSGVVVNVTGTTFTITHGMGSSLLYAVQVIRTANGSGETVFTDVARTNTTITITFKAAPADGDYTALITKMN